jgi:hypothetical protein
VIKHVAEASGSSPEAAEAALKFGRFNVAANSLNAATDGGVVVLGTIASLSLLLLLRLRSA